MSRNSRKRKERKRKRREEGEKERQEKGYDSASPLLAASSSSHPYPTLYSDVISVLLSFLHLKELNRASHLDKEWMNAASSMKSNQCPFIIKDAVILHSISQSCLSHHLNLKMDESVNWGGKPFSFESIQFLHTHGIKQAATLNSQSTCLFPKNLACLEVQFDSKKSADITSTELKETVAITSTVPSLQMIRLFMQPVSFETLTLPIDVFEPLRKLPQLLTFDCIHVGEIEFRFNDGKVFRSLPAFTRLEVWRKLTPPQIYQLSQPPCKDKFKQIAWWLSPLTESDIPSLLSHSSLSMVACSLTFPPSFLTEFNKLTHLAIGFQCVNVDVNAVTAALSALTSLVHLDVESHPAISQVHIQRIVEKLKLLATLVMAYLVSLTSLHFLSIGHLQSHLTILHVTDCVSLPRDVIVELTCLSSLQQLDLSRSFKSNLDDFTVGIFTPKSRLFNHLMYTKLKNLVSFTYSPR